MEFHPQDDCPRISRRQRVRRREAGSTSCVAAARTTNRRRQRLVPVPASTMALLLSVAAGLLLAAEMPAQVSARLHEQQQQNIQYEHNTGQTETFVDYDFSGEDLNGHQKQKPQATPMSEEAAAATANAAELAADQSDQQSQHHRRLQEMKNEWPECIGMQAEDCVALVEAEAPDAYTLIVRPKDYDFHRVIIRVDNDSLVTKTPLRG